MFSFLGSLLWQLLSRFPRKLSGKKIHLPMQETCVCSPDREDPLEEEMASHSSLLAWRIPSTGELGRLQSMGRKELGMTERLKNHTTLPEEL